MIKLFCRKNRTMSYRSSLSQENSKLMAISSSLAVTFATRGQATLSNMLSQVAKATKLAELLDINKVSCNLLEPTSGLLGALFY